MTVKNVLLAAALLAPAALAQQGAWGQCGGINWGGQTTCVTGYYCFHQNPWYFQCIPGTASTTAAPASSTTIATSTSSSKVATSTSSSKVATSTSSTRGSTSISSTKGTTTIAPTSTTSVGGGSTTTVAVAGNPFAGVQIYANPYYSSEIYSLAIPSLTASLAVKASAVAKVGTFVWLDTAAKVPTVDTYLTNIEALNAAGASPPVIGAFVVYDLPDRDCAALASNGEYSIANNGVANYKAYIDSIRAVLVKHSGTKVVLCIEPDSLANLVTNLNVAKCSNAEAAYKECTIYALEQLNLPNVSMYMDAGHAGWLGWSANIGPAATLFSQIYASAGKPASLRGLATNVANYNAWSVATCAPYTSGDSNCDEKRYINALAPLLTAAGFPAHFIMDTSRDGVQPTAQNAWGDWCNVIGTGFGVRPTTNTGDPLEDAFVWIKPGGECDGTSNSSSARFDAHCGYADALQPAPEAGTWFQAYFAQLLTNANPSF